MSTPPRRSVVAAFVAVTAMATGLVANQAYASTPTAQVSAVATSTQAVSLATTTSTSSPNVLTPEVTSLSAAETSDPMRGQYRWMGYGSQPTTWPASDVYYRDQTYWGRLEPTKGVYDFKWIEDGLKKAGETKGKFGFRVMAYCPSCWMTTRTDKVSFPAVTPSYIPLVPGTEVPDWNSEAFLSGYERLVAALGAKYANDPRLGYVDVGGYGKYGEWWVDRTDPRITEDNGLRLVRAVNKAFPTKTILFNTMQTIDFTLKVLATNPRMGLRTDSLGAPGMYSMVTDRIDTRLRDMWKTRPFFSEWATTGDPVAGADQVRTYHVSTTSSHNMRLTYDNMTSTQKAAYESAVKSAGYRYAVTKATVSPITAGQVFRVDLAINNAGSAPTYEPWTVRLVLRNGTGQRVATLPINLDLRKVLPGTMNYAAYLTAPPLPNGTYRTFIEAVDPVGYSAPLHWLNGSRYSDGTYALGTVGVGVEVVGRLAGSDRYATSAAISAATFAPGVPVAYVATGGNFPDALSGAPAGGVKKGPVLLATPSSIPAAVQQELIRLKPARIVILGGATTVSDSVKAALRSYTTGSVTRLAGSDRYATSAAISAATFAAGVPVAYVATGGNFPDALSGAPAGGVKKGPVLLVGQNAIPTVVQRELVRLRPARIVILGGSDTVSNTVKTALQAYTAGGVTRLAGSDRYATSAAISAATFATNVPVVYVAVGGNFPDALSGAPAGGVNLGPVLLTTQNSIPAAVQQELTRLKPARIVILGGTTTVSDSVKVALNGYVRAS